MYSCINAITLYYTKSTGSDNILYNNYYKNYLTTTILGCNLLAIAHVIVTGVWGVGTMSAPGAGTPVNFSGSSV